MVKKIIIAVQILCISVFLWHINFGPTSLCAGYREYPNGRVTYKSFYKAVTIFSTNTKSRPWPFQYTYGYIIQDDMFNREALDRYLRLGDSIIRIKDTLYVFRNNDTMPTKWKVEFPYNIEEECRCR